MKKLMSLGCLMALVLAGAPAFAADWFTGTFTNPTGGAWGTSPSGWTVTGDVASFNDWEMPAVFTATTAANTSSSNSIVKTSVMFTALDGSDGVPTAEMTAALEGVTPAKAGLTIVEDANEVKKFYGIVNGDWVELDGDTTDALAGVVPVKIEIMKGPDGNYVQYTVNDVVLTLNNDAVLKTATQDITVQSVSYRGNVPALSALVGYAYGNTTEAKEEIAVSSADERVPSMIAYNPAVLAARDIDVTDSDAVAHYLASEQKNKLPGWVNATLGIADDQTVAVASNECAKGSVTVNFGFASDGNSEIKYVIDTAKEAVPNATIETSKSEIHDVKVQVTQNGVTVDAGTVKVGVMNTGKELTEEQEKADVMVYDIVAIPFNAFQGVVTVANVLNTAELKNGDTLYVLNEEANKYDTYVLNEGVWSVVSEHVYVRGKAAAGTTPAPENAVLTAGQAVWIERHATSKIVFTGKGETSVGPIQCGEGYSLVANPTIKDFSLNDAGSAKFGNNGDKIIIEDVANPKQFEKCEGVWGEWKVVETENVIRGRRVTELQFVKTATIPAGIGFWYYNTTKTAVEIDFGSNVTE